MKRGSFPVFMAAILGYCLPAFAQNKTFQIKAALSIGFDDDKSGHGRTYSNTRVPVGTKWALRLGGADPNAPFALCASKNYEVLPCIPNFGKTDSLGNWTLTGTFDNAATGDWTEWAEFQPGVVSNRITFSVSDTTIYRPMFTINDTNFGIFHVGQPWTLMLRSGYLLRNAAGEICAEYNGRSLGCAPAVGTLDAYDNWTASGVFSAETAGGWTLWLKFANGSTSERVVFTVDNGPLEDTSCQSGTLRPIGPNAGFANFRRFESDWNPTSPAPYSLMPAHPGGLGNTLEYLGCNGVNYVWLEWEYGDFATVAVRAPWAGQTDRGLRIGDTLERFQTLYPAAHRPAATSYKSWPADVDVWNNGPLRVAFKNGKVFIIQAFWDPWESKLTDQIDPVSDRLGPRDLTHRWY